MATLEGRQVSWKERIDDYMSIKGVFLAVIVAGTMAATIILVAYAVSTGQVSDQMTGKMRIPSTHSMPGVMVDEKVVGDKFVDNEAKKPVSSWTEHIDSLLAKEENAAQPAPEQPSQRSEEHTSELQSPYDLVCRLLLEKKKKNRQQQQI